MERDEVFDLLDDASRDYIERLEEFNLVSCHLTYTEDGLEETYALTDLGEEYFDLE